MPTLVKRHGLSLVEVLVAMAIFSLVVPLLFATYSLTLKLTQRAKDVNVAVNLAEEKIETLRLTGFDSIALNPNPNAVTTSLLPSGFTKTYVENYLGNDKIKKITVTVYWANRPESNAITVTTLIGQGGING